MREHLLECDERDGVCVCILTDFCAGGDLAKRIAAAGAAGLRFSERCVLTWLLQIAEGLAAIHAQRMIHRDLKPANLLLLARPREAQGAARVQAGAPQPPLDDPCGGLKVGDLGVATLRGCVGAITVVGSPAYMAPEVSRGEGSGEGSGGRYGRAADIWSLGVVLVELATLRRPRLHAKPAGRLDAAATECAAAVERAGYSAGLAALARAMLSLEPERRPDALGAAAAARALLGAGGWATEGAEEASAPADDGAEVARACGLGALPVGERVHLELRCTCQPWPVGSAPPVVGRLVLTSSLLVFCAQGGGQAPTALPLGAIVEMAVLSADEDGGAIRVRTADGLQLALGSVLSCTAVQLAVSDRIRALGGSAGSPPRPTAPAPAQAAGRAVPSGPGGRGAQLEQRERSASLGAPHADGLGMGLQEVVELGIHTIRRAGADAAEACALM